MTRWETAAADYRERLYRALGEDGEVDELVAEGEALLRRVDQAGTPDVSLDVALALGRRYERADAAADLERAIAVLRGGLAVSARGTRATTALLTNLGVLLLRSFERFNRMPDLDAAIEHLTAARRAEGDYTSRSPVIHSMLGAGFFRRAAATGDAAAGEASIALLERAVGAAAPGSREWVQRQLNLCNPLFLRAERGDQAAVDRIQRIVGDVASRVAAADPLTKEILLVSSRASRLAFDWTRDPRRLDQALADYHRLLLRDDLSTPEAALARSNFGNTLRVAAEETGRSDLLDDAVRQFTAALELLAGRPAEAAKQRANLAKALVRRYEARGDGADLHDAVRLLRTVVAADSLAESTLGAESTANLGGALLRLGEDTHDQTVVEEGWALLRRSLSAVDPAENPEFVMQVSAEVGRRCLAIGRHDLAAATLEWGLAGLAAADRLSTGSPSRGRLLRRGAGLVQLAAFAFIHAERPEDGVLALERGRARALTDALKLDVAALDDLAAAGRADLADAYAATVRQLRAAEPRIAVDLPDVAIGQVRALRERLDGLVRDVQAVPGFEGFARPVDLATVRRAAAVVPLVYGCATEFGAVLVVVPGHGPIEAIHLPDLDSGAIERRAVPYLAALERLRDDPGAPGVEDAWAGALDDVTRWLGDVLMSRLGALLSERGVARAALLMPGWLGLLPVTAARLGSGATTAGDAVAWCQAPSAAALAAASSVAAVSATRSAVLVGDPQPTAEEPLASAAAELAGAGPAFARTTVLLGNDATRTAVLRALPNHDVAHFACHGVGDPSDPLGSFLLLADDERLTLRDVLRLRVWRMRLCVLSACDTATIGDEVPDEYVSLPAGLIQAGAAAVIATQWPVWDVAAAVMSVRFYALWPGVEADPVVAFNRARLWLRDATRRDVEQFVELRLSAGPARALLDGLRGVPPQARPFGALQDWAAFTYVGC